MDKIKIGLKGNTELIVAENNTARQVQSGSALVLATPVIARLAEKAAWQSVKPFLEDTTDTVGSVLNIHHVSPTPIGQKVLCVTTLTHIEERKLSFRFEVFDETGKVAFGIHERVIVNTQKFQEKAYRKKQAPSSSLLK